MNRLLSESLVYGITNILGKMINIILLPLYANMFSVSEYGIIAIVTVFSSIVAQLVVLQLDSSAFRFVVDRESDKDINRTYSSWFWTQLSLATAALLICVSFQSQLSHFLFSAEGHGDIIVLSILSIPINTIESVCSTQWRIRGRKWHVAVTSLISLLILLCLNYYLIKHMRLGIISLAISTLVVSTLKSTFLLPFITKTIHPKHFDFSLLKEMLKFSLPYVPAGISLWVVTLLDRIILEKYYGTEEVGLYQMANNMANLLMLPISAFIQAWTPYVFSILKNDNHKNIIAKLTLVFVLATSACALLLSLFNSEFLYILTTPAYYRANSFVPLLLFSTISMGLYQISGIGSAIVKKTNAVLYATLLAAVLNISLNFLLIPPYKTQGACWATFVSYSVIPIYLFVISYKVYRIPYNYLLMTIAFLAGFVVCQSLNPYFENFTFSVPYLALKLLFCLGLALVLFLKKDRIVSLFKV